MTGKENPFPKRENKMRNETQKFEMIQVFQVIRWSFVCTQNHKCLRPLLLLSLKLTRSRKPLEKSFFKSWYISHLFTQEN